MPQIVIKGMKELEVAQISGDIARELAAVSGVAQDWFSVEYLPSVFYVDGVKVDHYPMIKVYWFDRGQELKDSCAKVIDNIVRKLGYEQIEIFFVPLAKADYYENGEHY